MGTDWLDWVCHHRPSEHQQKPNSNRASIASLTKRTTQDTVQRAKRASPDSRAQRTGAATSSATTGERGHTDPADHTAIAPLKHPRPNRTRHERQASGSAGTYFRKGSRFHDQSILTCNFSPMAAFNLHDYAYRSIDYDSRSIRISHDKRHFGKSPSARHAHNAFDETRSRKTRRLPIIQLGSYQLNATASVREV